MSYEAYAMSACLEENCMPSSESLGLWEEKGKLVLPTNQFIEPILEIGSGSFVWDIDGKKYLDLNCGQFCLCFGHNYAPFIEAVNRQLAKITHTNTNTLSSVVFQSLEKLIEITEGAFTAGILLSTGSEAVEFALRFAKSISRREKMAALDHGYHGLSLGSQSVSNSGKWAIPRVAGTLVVPVPKHQDEVVACLAAAKRVLDENRGEIAAFIMEPILGAGGMIFPPIDFLKEVRAMCDQNDVILIFDECQTGFGRTGRWFCYQKYGVTPDMLIFGKLSGAGFPVSGVLMNDRLTEGMRHGTQTHFSSHQNDPLPAAVLLFVIEEIERLNLLEVTENVGKVLLGKISDVARRRRALVDPRGIGLMTAFNLDERLFADGKNPGHELTQLLLSSGVLIQSISRGRIFRVMPNFFISMEDIDFFIEALDAAVEKVANE
ncbi:MAG: aspartate aminotransferase family protein [Candidatus Hydrogenedentales bacterium]|jgi:4-aminobutyrate aminotransferase-like enzyme